MNKNKITKELLKIISTLVPKMAKKLNPMEDYLPAETKVKNKHTGQKGLIYNGYTHEGNKWTEYEVAISGKGHTEVWETKDMVIAKELLKVAKNLISSDWHPVVDKLFSMKDGDSLIVWNTNPINNKRVKVKFECKMSNKIDLPIRFFRISSTDGKPQKDNRFRQWSKDDLENAAQHGNWSLV